MLDDTEAGGTYDEFIARFWFSDGQSSTAVDLQLDGASQLVTKRRNQVVGVIGGIGRLKPVDALGARLTLRVRGLVDEYGPAGPEEQTFDARY